MKSVGQIRRKLVIIGDSGCGKTSLLNVLARGTFPMENPPPIINENQIAEFEVDGKRVELALWDVSTKQGYENLEKWSYTDSQVLLVCFSVENPDSFTNVEEKWIVKALEFAPNTPIILVGLKTELRCDAEAPITKEQGTAVAKKIKAKHYMECSAKTGDGVNDLFQTATKVALVGGKKKSGKCMIL